MNKNLKGFTLVEVLIVIIIVGILIAALLPRLVGTQSRARNTARQGHVNQVGQAAALLLNDNPAAVVTGVVNGAWPAAVNLTSVPTDPQGANGVQATVSFAGTSTPSNYNVVGNLLGEVVVIAQLEAVSNGNCEASEMDTRENSSNSFNVGYSTGDSFCVKVQ